MEIEFSTISDDGNALPDDDLTDGLTIFLDLQHAKATAKGMLSACEALERKSRPSPWLSFKLKGNAEIIK